MRPISLLVDLTNYVLLEQGQPLHAFDLAKLEGGRIIVREAIPGEKLVTLNGDEHELQAGQMMICDAVKPVAAAGIMGGLETEVGPKTTMMLLESAHFVGASVRKTRKQLGLNTEASYRFERWVDPAGVVAALNRFTELYGQIASTTGIVAGVYDVYPVPFALPPVRVRMSRACRLLGMEVADDEAKEYLRKLGFTISDRDPISAVAQAIVSVVSPSSHGEFMAQPPTWRPDIVREDDVIEEIGRVHGYDRIPETPPKATLTQGGVFGIQAFIDEIRESMLRSDFHQMISHSLRDVHPLDFTDNRRVEIRNPHSPEMRYLRNSLLPGLAEAARRNGGKDLHLFEIGKVFVKGDYQTDESPELAILTTGALYPPHWLTPPVSGADYFSIKGLLEELGTTCKVHFHFDRPLNLDPRFHPTRQASILADRGNLHIGIFGQIHPDLAEQLDLPELTFLAEVDLLVLYGERDDSMKLREISRNPAVRRDIAILIDKAIPYKQIEDALVEACGNVLEKHWLFDVYSGQGIPEGHHSLAIAMQLRKMGENMTDEEANAVRDRAVAALQGLGAKLR
jgi:phenylalanyl-tRNA synthetase beta chain